MIILYILCYVNLFNTVAESSYNNGSLNSSLPSPTFAPIFLNELENVEKELSTDAPVMRRPFPTVERIHSDMIVPKLASQLYSRGKMDECWKEAVCQPLEVTSCLGVKLPYTHTSLALSNLPSQRAALEALDYMSALQNLPHCWSVVQPFLCAILFPQCNQSSVQLPSREMCAITRGPCRLFEKENGWPEYLQCKADFPPKCKTASRDLQFNTTGQCSPPLIKTANEDLWFDGIKGCGIQCADPLFTAEEHEDLQGFIALLGGLCLAFSAFTVVTYLIDWKCASKYPALIIFYINGCFLVASIGFMVQFHDNVREKITCYSDGTLRRSEPSSGGNLSCVVVFVCVYYFMIAAGMWFIILGYAWHRSFKSLAAGQCQQNLNRKASYFHLISWSIPLIFTIGVIASAEVKADSAVGICFLSSTISVRVAALLVPISLIILIGSFFLVGGLRTLVKMKLECSNIISDHANKKIVETIIRLGIFILTVTTFLLITIYCHIYIFRNQEDWKTSLRDYILCVSGINSKVSGECQMVSRPSINLYKLHLLALFGSGIIMASWCWTTNTVEAWQRFLRRVVGVGGEEPVRLTKHKVIAQAFAKRNDLNNAGRLSISLQSLHSDPVGLNFEMNSATSCEVSSVFAAAIPYLMNRRGAVSGSSAFVFRRNSVDSEYSISRRVSVESALNRRRYRRHSLDSQISFHVSDVERLAAMQTAARFGDHRRRRRDWFLSLRKGKKAQSYDRRNSTSDDSNTGSMILPTLNMSTNDSLFTTMMKRLNLSSEEHSFARLKKNHVGLNNATDSEEEVRDNKENVLAPSFSRKYNGFKKKVHNSSSQVIKASVGVQTSLESLITSQPLTKDQSCQVTTPLLRRNSTSQQASMSSPSGSITSLSETGKVKETSFIAHTSRSHNIKMRSVRSLSPLSKSLKKSPSVKGQPKKRSFSENESNHCVLNFKDCE